VIRNCNSNRFDDRMRQSRSFLVCLSSERAVRLEKKRCGEGVRIKVFKKKSLKEGFTYHF